MADILDLPAPELPNPSRRMNVPTPVISEQSSPSQLSSSADLLSELIENLGKSSESRYEKKYVKTLQNSLDMLQKNSTSNKTWCLKEDNDITLSQVLQKNLVLHQSTFWTVTSGFCHL